MRLLLPGVIEFSRSRALRARNPCASAREKSRRLTGESIAVCGPVFPLVCVCVVSFFIMLEMLDIRACVIFFSGARREDVGPERFDVCIFMD